MFFLEGVPAILLGLGVLLYLTNTPREANWLSVYERTWLIDALEQESSWSYVLASSAGLEEVFSKPRKWKLVIIYFGLNCAGYGINI